MPSTLSFIYIKYYIREYFISKFVPVTVYLHKRTRIVKNLSLSNRNKNKTCFHKIWGSDIKGISVKQHTHTHTHSQFVLYVIRRHFAEDEELLIDYPSTLQLQGPSILYVRFVKYNNNNDNTGFWGRFRPVSGALKIMSGAQCTFAPALRV